MAKLSALLAGSLSADCKGKIEIASKELASYTGFELSYPDVFPSFTTPADHPGYARLDRSWKMHSRVPLRWAPGALPPMAVISQKQAQRCSALARATMPWSTPSRNGSRQTGLLRVWWVIWH